MNCAEEHEKEYVCALEKEIECLESDVSYLKAELCTLEKDLACFEKATVAEEAKLESEVAA